MHSIILGGLLMLINYLNSIVVFFCPINLTTFEIVFDLSTVDWSWHRWRNSNGVEDANLDILYIIRNELGTICGWYWDLLLI